MFEVTSEGTIVWEYMYPTFAGANASNAVYRAYRVPYGWIPQLAVRPSGASRRPRWATSGFRNPRSLTTATRQSPRSFPRSAWPQARLGP